MVSLSRNFSAVLYKFFSNSEEKNLQSLQKDENTFTKILRRNENGVSVFNGALKGYWKFVRSMNPVYSE